MHIEVNTIASAFEKRKKLSLWDWLPGRQEAGRRSVFPDPGFRARCKGFEHRIFLDSGPFASVRVSPGSLVMCQSFVVHSTLLLPYRWRGRWMGAFKGSQVLLISVCKFKLWFLNILISKHFWVFLETGLDQFELVLWLHK